MHAKRDKVWAELDAEYKTAVTHQVARFAQGWSFGQLPADVVHMAKRCLLDAIGCAIGGYHAPGRGICESVARGLGGTEEATVIGSGLRTNPIQAAMVNAFAVRYLDYNDLGGGGHNSDAIPALLAVAEAEQRSGRDLLTAIVLSYELGARWMESMLTGDLMADYKRMTDRGWCMDIRGGLNMPPAIGLLMGLDEEQVANAIGSVIVRSFPSNHLDANDEEFVMAKNLRFGHVACDSILACLLAREGFTGPRRAYEGEYGYSLITSGGVVNPEVLTSSRDNYFILETSFKPLCTNFTTQSSIQATIALCQEHNIEPDQVAQVKIVCCEREAMHTTYAAKKYPRNGESADHSLFYGNALAIIERDFGPESFAPEKFTDPKVLALIDRIDYEANPDWPGFSDAGGSIIRLKDGTVYEKYLEVPHGHHSDPMSDEELQTKFRRMATMHFSEEQTDRLINTIWSIEETESVAELMKLLVFPAD